MDKLQTRLDDAREKLAEANAKTTHLTERLEQAERHTAVTSQQLMSHSADVTSFAKNKVSTSILAVVVASSKHFRQKRMKNIISMVNQYCPKHIGFKIKFHIMLFYPVTIVN